MAVQKLTDTGTASPVASYATLQTGSKGADVQQLQTTLNGLGYNVGTADGIYGSKTAAGVKAYQQAMGLTADGLAGQQTLSSLYSKSTTPTATSPLPDVTKGTGAGSTAGTTGGAVEITDTGSNQSPTQPTTQPVQPVTEKPTPTTTQPVTTPTPKQTVTPTPQPATPTPPAGTGGTTGGQVGTGQTGGGTETGGLKPPAEWTPEEYVPQENPYIQELLDMEFNYDPFQDPEYLRRAAGYENQVAQMMIGRGGLWSSVKDSAVQSSLLNLQMDMTEQKYGQYLEDRNFKMQIAKFASDEEQKNFNRYIQEQELAFNKNKEEWDRYIQESEMEFKRDQEAWDRYTWQEEINLKRQQEAFDQSLAIAKHNADMAAQAHRQEMDRLALEQEAQARLFEQQMSTVGNNISTASNELYGAAKEYDREKRIFDSFYTDLKKTGKMTPGQAQFFGVSAGSRIEWASTQRAILQKAAELDAYGQEIYNRAGMIGEEKTIFQNVSDWYNAIKGKTTTTPTNNVTATTR